MDNAPEQSPTPGHLWGVYALFLLLVSLFTFPLVLSLGGQLRSNIADAYFFAWVLGSIARRLFESPWALFDADIFYPYGHSLTFAEPLLIPAVLGFAPIYAASGNPVLAYNLTLLLFHALSGLAAYYLALRLTGSRLAGWVAGIVFALSPFRTGYYNMVHMQLPFAVPLALLGFARFLERQQIRDWVWALFFVWCQAITVWYFGIPLGLLLAVFTLGFLLLRPRGWRRRTILAAGLGGIALLLALTPIAWPYLETWRELGFQRDLDDAARRSADLLSYVDAGADHRFYRLAHAGTYPTLFPGFTALILAGLALVCVRSADPGPILPRLRQARRLVTWTSLATLGAIALFLLTGGVRLRILGVAFRLTTLDRAIVLLLLLGVAALALRGWAWLRGPRARPLSRRDWVVLLGLLTVFFIVLSLGPVLRLGGEEVGAGIYSVVYTLFPPLRALRIPLRIGFFAVFLIGLLAAFGVSWLEKALRESRARHALAAVPLLLLVEYHSIPLAYEPVRWDHPPPVYQWLSREPEDTTILEWPSANDDFDSRYLFWSLLHRKRLVHGVSGFIPEFTQEVWVAVLDLPNPRSLTVLRSVYPLRYLIVHLQYLNREQQARWQRWSHDPPTGFTFVGRFGESLVFRLESESERGRQWERTFSSKEVTRRPRARLSLALTREDPETQQTVDVTFNGRVLSRLAPTAAPIDVQLLLPSPYPKAERNILRLDQRYDLVIPTNGDARYRIGRTGVVSPVDLVVISAGKEHGDRAAIFVNGTDSSPNQRGYNVVAVDPASRIVKAREAFDTFIAPSESGRLARFIQGIPAGWIVVAAIKDEGVGQLGEDAIRALHSLGGAIDPRGSLFISHLLIGVKGAPKGTAIEVAGHRRLERAVGADRRDRTMVVRAFRLE